VYMSVLLLGDCLHMFLKIEILAAHDSRYRDIDIHSTLQVSFAKEPYKRDNILHKSLTIDILTAHDSLHVDQRRDIDLIRISTHELIDQSLDLEILTAHDSLCVECMSTSRISMI